MDAYVRQRLGRPAQETVTLGVASQFQVQVQRRRIGARVGLHRQRMVDRHVHRQHRIEHARIDAGLGERVAHGGDIDQGGRAGGVVHQHAARLEGDLGFACAVGKPAEQRGDRGVAFRIPHIAQRVFQQQPQHDGQAEIVRAVHGGKIQAGVLGAVQGEAGVAQRCIGVFHSCQFCILHL
ncbi:hypothetical protein D3C71_1399680 [compost metagenome]